MLMLPPLESETVWIGDFLPTQYVDRIAILRYDLILTEWAPRSSQSIAMSVDVSVVPCEEDLDSFFKRLMLFIPVSVFFCPFLPFSVICCQLGCFLVMVLPSAHVESFSGIFFFFFSSFFLLGVKLIGGGYVIIGAYPV